MSHDLLVQWPIAKVFQIHAPQWKVFHFINPV